MSLMYLQLQRTPRLEQAALLLLQKWRNLSLHLHSGRILNVSFWQHGWVFACFSPGGQELDQALLPNGPDVPASWLSSALAGEVGWVLPPFGVWESTAAWMLPVGSPSTQYITTENNHGRNTTAISPPAQQDVMNTRDLCPSREDAALCATAFFIH